MIWLAASEGYTHTTVSQITRGAGISRTIFYEHFADKEACFLAAHEQIARRLTTEVEQALAGADSSQALATSIAALVAFATREPGAFQLVTHEALIAGDLAAGARPREARDKMIDSFEHAIEQARREKGQSPEVADIPVRLVLGATIRLIGIRMRQETRPVPGLDALPMWVDFYTAPAGRARWQSLSSEISMPSAIDPAEGPARARPWRGGLPEGANAEALQRERILYATADVVCERGYAAMSVSDIAASADVSREVFYSHFKDKSDALLHTQRLVFEQMIAASAGAFFTVSTPWPERIWDAISATVAWILEHPTLAHFEFIGGYALGPADAKKLDENILGFLVFLEQGEAYRPDATKTPQLVREAIACAVVELVGQYIRHYRSAELPGLIPLLSYVVLAPFLGVEAANAFIDGKLNRL
jgi:AcrR family transcriptional regulator